MDINLYSPREKISERSFLSINDLTTEDLFELVTLARQFKRQKKAGEKTNALAGKTIGAIAELPSIRWATALELAVRSAGGDLVTIDTLKARLRFGENLPDVISSVQPYGFDAFAIRTRHQEDLKAISKRCKQSVVNMMTEDCHPMQVVCDLLTIWEKKGRVSNLKVAYLGLTGSVSNSILIGATKAGMSVAIACPKENFPSQDLINNALQYGEVILTENAEEAIRGADIVYTDGYASLNAEERLQAIARFAPYRITDELMALAKPDAIFMHCLPMCLDMEVSSSVANGRQSVVAEQTENRLYAIQAVLALCLKR